MGLSRSLRAIAAAENRQRLRWATTIRWLTIIGFMGLAIVARALGRLASVDGCAIAAVFGSIMNGLNRWSFRRRRWIGAVLLASVAGDVALISWVVVDTGGLRSPFIMMYVVQVVATAMLVNMEVAALSVAVCVSGFLGALQVQRLLETDSGWLPATTPAEVAADQYVWALFLLYCLALLVYLGGYISDRLRDSERDLAAKNEHLRETIASLAATHATLRETYDRLTATEAQLIHSEKIRALGQFVAGVAHELNNPISFVSANLEYLRRHMSRVAELVGIFDSVALAAADRARVAAARESLQFDALVDDLPLLLADCEEGIRRAHQIVAGLQAFARSEREESWQLADVHAGLEASVTLLRHRLPPGVIVERRYGTLPLVECLPGQLNQVFVNLLANAADAVGDQGRITIETAMLPRADAGGAAEPARALVTISDDGPGIPDEALPRLFEPFFTTKEVGKGVGLGLSVSHGIVRRHGGRLSVASGVGGGASLTVTIPVERIVPETESGEPGEFRLTGLRVDS